MKHVPVIGITDPIPTTIKMGTDVYEQIKPLLDAGFEMSASLSGMTGFGLEFVRGPAFLYITQSAYFASSDRHDCNGYDFRFEDFDDALACALGTAKAA